MNATMIYPAWWVAPFAALMALAFAAIFHRKMMAEDEGSDAMREIAQHVREGAMAYLGRQYRVVAVVFILLFITLFFLAWLGVQNPLVPFAFLTGGFYSALCGYIGMRTATSASSRTAQGCSIGLNRGLQIAFRSGAVMGLSVVGFALFDLSVWYLVLDRVVYTAPHMAEGLSLFGMHVVPAGMTDADKLLAITSTLITCVMGASTQALFARVGGGIYTKAADVGADLVGKLELGIPEDDARNPAVVADNVGDNVGDVAGMGADLYESYCGSILATAALGAAVGVRRAAVDQAPLSQAVGLVVAPMVVAGIGILFSIAGMFLVRCREGAGQKKLLRALLTGTLSSSALILLGLVGVWQGGLIPGGVVWSVVAGLSAGVILGQSTEYYTTEEHAPTRGIAEHSATGPATVIIDGLATGMRSSGIPTITVSVGILCAYGFSGGFSDPAMGLYGIGFAAVGMLATLGITLATDAYGPIADNAGGNAEMAKMPPEVRRRTDTLDSLGNTTAATGKGFAIGSAALTALALLAAYLEGARSWALHFGAPPYAPADALSDLVQRFDLHLMNPLLIAGLFLGGSATFVFCAVTMKAVGRAAGDMVREVRRQFREEPGIMEGTVVPDYARCVEISTRSAQREMLGPSLLAIALPIIVGLFLGVAGVAGLLVGALGTGFSLATFLNNAGGAWDNAKKQIEGGAHGGKKLEDGSPNPAHLAAVVGDTVGDPCKDTSGPSLNILIKLMTVVSIVFAPVIVRYSPLIQEWLGILR